jgi:hypothetical protein
VSHFPTEEQIKIANLRRRREEVLNSQTIEPLVILTLIDLIDLALLNHNDKMLDNLRKKML